MKKRKIMIIGTGGIGSYLIPLLNKTGLYDITIYDPDVVESKNISFQNFEDTQVGMLKVDAMDARYEIKKTYGYPVLTAKQLGGYDLVVCCADNLDIRRTMYNDKGLAWLDLRAQGRNGILVSFLENPDLYGELTSGPDGSFSCQGDAWDGGNTNLHYMHVAVAGIGAEWIQRWFNEEEVFKHRMIAG